MAYDPAIASGILMHRDIDAFTDTHPLVSASKQVLRPHFGLYSGILVDLFYDHFLAAGWNDYSPLPLPDFAAFVYKTLEPYLPLMPQFNQHMFPYMKSENWLVRYATVDGIRHTLVNMSRRMNRKPDFSTAHIYLLEHYAHFQQHFTPFFNDLQDFLHRKWPPETDGGMR